MKRRIEILAVVAIGALCGWLLLERSHPVLGMIVGSTFGVAWVVVARTWLPGGRT